MKRTMSVDECWRSSSILAKSTRNAKAYMVDFFGARLPSKSKSKPSALHAIPTQRAKSPCCFKWLPEKWKQSKTLDV
jgi:hypothetical protein